jgi:ABC-type proline/glycine betaine transport system ATPase subunit
MERAKEEEKTYSSIDVLPKMNLNTEPSKLVINASLDPKIVDLLCATEDDEVELKALRTEVFELENNTPEKIREKYKARRLRLLPFRSFLTNLIRELGSEQIRINQDLYATKVKKKLIADSLSKKTFSELPISEIGSEQWTTMWASIKKFVECLNHNNIFPPIEGSHCPTCLQIIDNTTATRLLSFEDYLHNEFHKDASNALDKWNISLLKIKELNFSTEPYKAILDEIQGKDERLGLLFYELIDHLSKRVEKILKNEPIFDFSELNLEPLTRLNNHIQRLEEYENTLSDDTKKAQVISLKKQKILEIEDRIKVGSAKDLIKTEIQKAQKINLFSDLKKSTSTTTITLLSNEITSSGSIGKLQEFFDQELVKLGFNHFNVATITKGTKGNQVFSLGLSGKEVSIPDIASEGEQKCISLAGFFAELTADNRNSAIIFDDPVNSLDHIWRQKFSKRIADEANKRQVIVLTHDLPFLKMLQEVATNIQVKAITRNKKVTGIPLDSPPWDALKTEKRIGILKVKLVEARKISEKSISEEYQNYVGSIYGKKRETWERLVEEWLIRNVVERFSREIKTQNTRYLIDITERDVQKISDAMSKCSTYMNGHDMAEAISGYFPDIDELENDLNELETYFIELKKRRK